MEHGLEQLPGPMAVGIGQRGARRGLRQTEVFQLPFTGLQPFCDLAQRFGLPQLTEKHRDELSPAAETPCMPLRMVLPDRLFKPVPRNQLQNLTADAAYSFHGEVSWICWCSFLRN